MIYIYIYTRLVYGLVWVALDWICFARASRGLALDRIGLDWMHKCICMYTFYDFYVCMCDI